ncbi:isoaspartyl peptidase/L-asparaginase [Ignisphaera sp. 4213-co]|uniref:Plant-type L-asparaginase n=1 Tax=Ignisphaera cupida TaxID=3050454 RepID=A0ABD4Z7Y7_9CREN|nr:isoaspartyl peptidase/L-asparaginase [Ignisphaera sp. 4213-co]MDK6029467.1 isoaspartyl peptidase/L-asparaginase [Ignisphaera sp. 4213-co]
MGVVLAVHGGAGGWKVDKDVLEKVRNVIKEALEEGFKAYQNGSSLDMVVTAIEVLENSGVFNAGIGSTVDLSGSISMDAGIMFRGKAGAVAYVKYPKNPIKLARFVLEKTDHVIVAGDAADLLAKKIGLEPHPGPLKRILETYREYIAKIVKGEAKSVPFAKSIATWLSIGDTVGAVAVDKNGDFAAAVSTGGVFLKMPGRVGDSPIPGAGFYANECGAAAATGIGEYIILTHSTLRIVDDMCKGKSAEEATKNVLETITTIYGSGTAGFIALDRLGRVAGLFNTRAMPWGFINSYGELKVLGL